MNFCEPLWIVEFPLFIQDASSINFANILCLYLSQIFKLYNWEQQFHIYSFLINEMRCLVHLAMNLTDGSLFSKLSPNRNILDCFLGAQEHNFLDFHIEYILRMLGIIINVIVLCMFFLEGSKYVHMCEYTHTHMCEA